MPRASPLLSPSRMYRMPLTTLRQRVTPLQSAFTPCPYPSLLFSSRLICTWCTALHGAPFVTCRSFLFRCAGPEANAALSRRVRRSASVQFTSKVGWQPSVSKTTTTYPTTLPPSTTSSLSLSPSLSLSLTLWTRRFYSFDCGASHIAARRMYRRAQWPFQLPL